MVPQAVTSHVGAEFCACWHALPALLPVRGIRDYLLSTHNRQTNKIYQHPPIRTHECDLFNLLNKTIILTLTLMMISTQSLRHSLTHSISSNSPSQDCTHLDDHSLLAYDFTAGFKPVLRLFSWLRCLLI